MTTEGSQSGPFSAWITPFRITRRISQVSEVASAACMSIGRSISIRRPRRSSESWSAKAISAWKARRNPSTSDPKAAA